MYTIKLPQKARIPSEGVVAEWLISKGQAVQKGQILVQIEVFGQVISLESPLTADVLEILVGAGIPFSAQQPLMILGRKGEDVSAVLEKLAPKKAPAKADMDSTSVISTVKQSQPETAVEAEKEVKMESKTPAGKVVPILMPQAGQTMEEGTVLSWKVKEGDVITTGQVILEIETDKAAMEVEAIHSGRLARIVVREGQSVPVKTPVAYLAESDADVDAYIGSQGGVGAEPSQKPVGPRASSATQAPAMEKRPAVVGDTGRVKASPAARRVAEEKGIDLAAISSGCGPGGRILSTDVLIAGTGDAAAAVPDGAVRHPLNKMRKAIAQNLAYSKQHILHFYLKLTVNAQALFDLYKQVKQQFQCSVNDFVVAACAKAIRQYPAFRSQYGTNEIVENPAVNIGVAVGTDNGLTVPVLLNVNRMDLKQLSQRTRQMAENARNGKVDGVGQGVFTITSLGMFGVEEFSAIINPPESAILAVGAIREDIKVENGIVSPTRLMTLRLSVDHRVIDGVMAAQFMKTLKELLEKPEQLVN